VSEFCKLIMRVEILPPSRSNITRSNITRSNTNVQQDGIVTLNIIEIYRNSKSIDIKHIHRICKHDLIVSAFCCSDGQNVKNFVIDLKYTRGVPVFEH